VSAPRTFDWDAIRARLARSSVQADPDGVDPERDRDLLRARAQVLAQAPAPSAQTDGADTVPVLAFELGGAHYAVETDWVVQACPLPPITTLAGLPGHVAGIAAFRGRVLAVIELRALLALPITRLSEPQAMVVLQGKEMEFALIADAIVGVRRYRRAAMSPGLPGLGALRAGYLMGIAPDRTALLDAGVMLGDRTLVVHGQ